MSDSLSFVSPQFNEDILLYLLAFLDDPLDLAHIFATNSRLSKLVSNPQIWQNLLQKYFNQECRRYFSIYKQKPFELFKNLYLFRLKQYYVAFGLKKCTKEDFLLFLNMTLGYIEDVNKLKVAAPQKIIKIYGFMMSQKSFALIEAKYGSSPKEYREKVYGQALIFCCRHNHPEELKLILERHPEFVDIDNTVESGFRWAARLGHIECLDQLIDNKKGMITSQLLTEIFISACSSNKKRTIDYFLNCRENMISEHTYGHAFIEWCQHPQDELNLTFLKKITMGHIQSGLLKALRHGQFTFAQKLLDHFDLLEGHFDKICLITLAEKNVLQGFLFIFKRTKIVPNSVFACELLRIAYQHDAFDIMGFLLDFYPSQLPTYLAQQAKLKLESIRVPVMIEQSPTLIFSNALNNEIDMLSEQLEALKLTCSSDQTANKMSYSL